MWQESVVDSARAMVKLVRVGQLKFLIKLSARTEEGRAQGPRRTESTQRSMEFIPEYNGH